MKKMIAAAFTLLCLGNFPAAQAGPVLYVGAGSTDFSQYENVDSAFAGKTTLGWHFDRIPLLIEASYLGTGKHDIDFDPVARNLQYRGGDFSIGGFVFRSEKLGLSAIAKGGYYHGRTELERTNLPNLSDDTDGFTSGLGVQWHFARWATLRLDVSALFGVRDFNGTNSDDDSTLWSTTAGIVLTVPSRKSAPRAEAAPATEAPAVATPAPAAEPTAAAPETTVVVAAATEAEPVAGDAPATAPFAETAPAAASADAAVTVNAPLVTKSDEVENAKMDAPQAEPVATDKLIAEARREIVPVAPAPSLGGAKPTQSSELSATLRVSLESGTDLLTRPVVGAKVDASTPRNSVAVLDRRVTNASGTWWFVNVGKLNGWVPEEALLHGK